MRQVSLSRRFVVLYPQTNRRNSIVIHIDCPSAPVANFEMEVKKVAKGSLEGRPAALYKEFER